MDIPTKSIYNDDTDSVCSTPPRMDGTSALQLGRAHMRSDSAASTHSLGGAGTSLSASMNSISSDGSLESHLVEQEDIIVLTHDVRSFKETLSRLRKIFHPEKEKLETMRVAAHEKLGEVLRILRSILEKYPPIQSTDLLMAAGTVIQQVKGHNYEDEKADPSEFFEAIDQLALAFSSRVSDYLMGDLDSSYQTVPKTRSCENLSADDGESDPFAKDRDAALEVLTPQEIDLRLLKLTDGVELALHRAKLWSKYAKDVMTYIDKRANLEADHARNLAKLAQSMRPILQEESFLPFQSVYCTALDQDFENSNTCFSTCALLQGHKFIEPLSGRRNEHEKARKQIKDKWQRELKRMHEAISNLRKAKSLYYQRQQEYEKAKGSALKAESSESSETSKVDKKRRLEDDASQRATEAETTYKACIIEANERQQQLQIIKGEVLKLVRELMYQCDQTMKAVTVAYFQLQHTVSAPAPVQFQTLCETSRLYEPGTQYMEYVKHLSPSGKTYYASVPFTFEPFSCDSRFDKDRRSNGSMESCEDSPLHASVYSKLSTDSKDLAKYQQPMKAWNTGAHAGMGSDSDSISSCHSNKSQETSPPGSPQVAQHKMLAMSSGDELETDHDNTDSVGRRTCMSRAAETHTFKKLKTPARCRECDSYVYFQGVECSECGLASHKKCLELLPIQCGHKRLPRKMTTFGVELIAHSRESYEEIPHIITKCIEEIDRKGYFIKGIYRVSGVKSRVEKLCQCFENGAELVDLTEVHPNVIANVLKLYLRQLPEPLLTFRLYPDFIKIAKDYPSQKDELSDTVNAVDELSCLVQRLPRIHFKTLAYLMHHLKRVAEHAEDNNMPPSNLGIVFGPTLLQTSEGSASLSSLVDTIHQTRVIELLISYADKIFGVPEEIYPDLLIINSGFGSRKCIFPPHNKAEKATLGRTLSGVSQVSDVDESPLVDPLGGSSDNPLPGSLATGARELSLTETEEYTHSSDDWLGSGSYSDDEVPDLPLPDDSVSKKSPLLPKSIGSLAMGTKRYAGNLPSSNRSEPPLKNIGEANQSSTVQIQTKAGDEESNRPVPPRRKNTPHSVAEQKCEMETTQPSPTSNTTLENHASQPSIYTSTTAITLTDQKAHGSAMGSRASTAELRRQFFEAPSKTSPEISGTAQQIDSPSRLSVGSYSGSLVGSVQGFSSQSGTELIKEKGEPKHSVSSVDFSTNSISSPVNISTIHLPLTFSSSAISSTLSSGRPLGISSTQDLHTQESSSTSKPYMEHSMRKLSCPEEMPSVRSRQIKKASRTSSSQEGLGLRKQGTDSCDSNVFRSMTKSQTTPPSHTTYSSSLVRQTLSSISSQEEIFQQPEPTSGVQDKLSLDRQPRFV
ncbi:rho GTPase-activating protein 45-like isoform X2 [Tachypleus tridentatus]|uniref:rho GTPase-activating protein 45-like isoform X2 n=1 Tax=Tachypleus tridentatus TaxID=6853 RepID=UPI003FD4C427